MSKAYGAEPQQAFVQSASAALTDSELVAASAGKQVKVVQAFAMADTAMVVTLQTGLVSRKFELYPGANGGAVLPASDVPWFATAVGESLTVTSDTAGELFVSVNYVVE